ncbi:hypothetical protein PAPYR_91 [Paratrimastix pyriformis]|uniref:Uncharacterized protein n=1 Tax=Paratrimastix pyriformis TaxID=342808 RepID=A0ABQ8UUU1_9EUKA|nr:hypothetical protein PAPYR_91 [Paratrimastix pyriformis]|eukprot:GAFH01005231.1.p1 GENE.GAFH01005231.1~~GAFH01005231.1.p1  ORF type:complete len:194 (+),score=28.46 GAFH01005231.1:11-592(+)
MGGLILLLVLGLAAAAHPDPPMLPTGFEVKAYYWDDDEFVPGLLAWNYNFNGSATIGARFIEDDYEGDGKLITYLDVVSPTHNFTSFHYKKNGSFWKCNTEKETSFPVITPDYLQHNGTTFLKTTTYHNKKVNHWQGADKVTEFWTLYDAPYDPVKFEFGMLMMEFDDLEPLTDHPDNWYHPDPRYVDQCAFE